MNFMSESDYPMSDKEERMPSKKEFDQATQSLINDFDNDRNALSIFCGANHWKMAGLAFGDDWKNFILQGRRRSWFLLNKYPNDEFMRCHLCARSLENCSDNMSTIFPVCSQCDTQFVDAYDLDFYVNKACPIEI
jgi:hypothetical protein